MNRVVGSRVVADLIITVQNWQNYLDWDTIVLIRDDGEFN